MEFINRESLADCALVMDKLSKGWRYGVSGNFVIAYAKNDQLKLRFEGSGIITTYSFNLFKRGMDKRKSYDMHTDVPFDEWLAMNFPEELGIIAA